MAGDHNRVLCALPGGCSQPAQARAARNVRGSPFSFRGSVSSTGFRCGPSSTATSIGLSQAIFQVVIIPRKYVFRTNEAAPGPTQSSKFMTSELPIGRKVAARAIRSGVKSAHETAGSSHAIFWCSFDVSTTEDAEAASASSPSPPLPPSLSAAVDVMAFACRVALPLPMPILCCLAAAGGGGAAHWLCFARAARALRRARCAGSGGKNFRVTEIHDFEPARRSRRRRAKHDRSGLLSINAPAQRRRMSTSTRTLAIRSRSLSKAIIMQSMAR